jgi:hypothetical protein
MLMEAKGHFLTPNDYNSRSLLYAGKSSIYASKFHMCKLF